MAYRPDVTSGDTFEANGDAAAEPARRLGNWLLPERVEQRGRSGERVLPGSRRPGRARVLAARRDRWLAGQGPGRPDAHVRGIDAYALARPEFRRCAGGRLSGPDRVTSRTSPSAAPIARVACCWIACGPYDTNQVSLDPAELPLDASLSSPTAMLTPAYRSGAVVRFPITARPQRRCGSCRKTACQSRQAPRFTRRRGSHGCARGLLYPDGRRRLQRGFGSWPGHRCRFSFQRPENGDPMPDLEEVRVPVHRPVNAAKSSGRGYRQPDSIE